jgi:hypothetical protein
MVRSLFRTTLARITEVLDLKVLRKGMNRQDTNREDQKANEQLANFLFLHQGYKRYKAGSNTMQRELLCLGKMPSLQPP